LNLISYSFLLEKSTSRDSLEEILRDGVVGGGCGSHQKAIMAILMQAGIPSEDIKLVAAVNPNLLKKMCPKEGKVIDPSFSKNILSHKLLLVNVGSGSEPDWKLYDQGMGGIKGYQVNLTDLSSAIDQQRYFKLPELKHYGDYQISHQNINYRAKNITAVDIQDYDGCFESRSDFVNKVSSGSPYSDICR